MGQGGAGKGEGGASPLKALYTEPEPLKESWVCRRENAETKPSSSEAVNDFTWISKELLGTCFTGFGT